MQETKRMADAANRMGQEAQERVQSGFEAASRSFSEANKGFQTLAAEMMEYSKAAFDDAIRTWEQLLRVRHLGDMVEVQTRYAQGAYDAYMSEMSKLGEMYLGTARNAAIPVKDTARRFS